MQRWSAKRRFCGEAKEEREKGRERKDVVGKGKFSRSSLPSFLPSFLPTIATPMRDTEPRGGRSTSSVVRGGSVGML